MSDIKTVLRDMGGIFIITGFVSLIAIFIPLFFSEIRPFVEFDGLFPLVLTSTIFFGLGLPLYYIFYNADPANFKSAMVTAALSWLIVSLIGSIPFCLIPYNIKTLSFMDPLSAFFESMSGWTGTGLTMVANEELLPKTLQFWRTFIQWIGGVGVIVLTLSILARPGTGSYVLYRGEARDQKTHPSVISTVRTIWWIFLLYTLIGITALTIVGFLTTDGMTPWQAFNHAMTGIATGGFSVTDDSIASFGIITQSIIIILMIFGSIAFAAHYDLLRGKITKFLKDAQFRTMIVLIITGVTILILLTYINNDSIPIIAIIFQFISALSCTGFSSVNNLGSWPESAKLILSFAMIIGGAAGSTAGGIKLFRALLLYKGVGWRIKQAISTPHRVFVHKLGDKPLSKENAMDLINEAAIISFMWLIMLSIGVMILMVLYPNETLGNIFFEISSAQGNVGLSIGLTSMNMFPIAKIILILCMWIGRLEIIPVIVLLKSIFGIRGNIL